MYIRVLHTLLGSRCRTFRRVACTSLGPPVLEEKFLCQEKNLDMELCRGSRSRAALPPGCVDGAAADPTTTDRPQASAAEGRKKEKIENVLFFPFLIFYSSQLPSHSHATYVGRDAGACWCMPMLRMY